MARNPFKPGDTVVYTDACVKDMGEDVRNLVGKTRIVKHLGNTSADLLQTAVTFESGGWERVEYLKLVQHVSSSLLGVATSRRKLRV